MYELWTDFITIIEIAKMRHVDSEWEMPLAPSRVFVHKIVVLRVIKILPHFLGVFLKRNQQEREGALKNSHPYFPNHHPEDYSPSTSLQKTFIPRAPAAIIPVGYCVFMIREGGILSFAAAAIKTKRRGH